MPRPHEKTKRPHAVTQYDEFALVDGALRIAVIADTHGAPHPRSEALVAEQRPHHILHAGDIGDLSVLDRFAAIAPVTAVRGNIDGHGPSIPDERVIAVRDGDATLLRMLLVHIAVYGPRLRADVARRASAEDASLVVCGHSHVPFLGRDRGVAMFNPGSIGPRRFSLPILFGVVTLDRQRVTMQHVDCETGRPWQP